MRKWYGILGIGICCVVMWSFLWGYGEKELYPTIKEMSSVEILPTSHLADEFSTELVSPSSEVVIKRDSTKERIRVKEKVLYFYDQDGNLEQEVPVEQLNPLAALTQGLHIHDYFDAEALYVSPTSEELINKTPTDAYLQTYILTEEEDKGPFILLCYYLTLANENGAMLAHYSAFIGFDEFGKQRFNWQRNRNISVPVVDTTYTYLLFSLRPVETTLNAGVKFQPDGFELWNLRDSTLIYQNISNDPNMVVGQPVTFREKNGIGNGYSHPNDRDIVSSSYAFFANEKTLYHWVYTKEMLDNDLEMFKKIRRYPTFEEIKKRPSTTKISLDHE